MFGIHLLPLQVNCSCSSCPAGETLISRPSPWTTLFPSFSRLSTLFPSRWRSSPLPLDLFLVRDQLCPFDSRPGIVSQLAQVINLQPSQHTEKVIPSGLFQSFSLFLKNFLHLKELKCQKSFNFKKITELKAGISQIQV